MIQARDEGERLHHPIVHLTAQIAPPSYSYPPEPASSIVSLSPPALSLTIPLFRPGRSPENPSWVEALAAGGQATERRRRRIPDRIGCSGGGGGSLNRVRRRPRAQTSGGRQADAVSGAGSNYSAAPAPSAISNPFFPHGSPALLLCRFSKAVPAS
jgi:hypothetical protein